ncbi:MAG: TolC family protein [Muribaculaceae bacterium]|nr:TolC family protein [Muribaculaceae bacterium]
MKKGSSIEYVSENRAFTDADDYSMETELPLADCQAAREKHNYYHRQVEVLREAYMGTHELMDNGKSNYLEVLTAQESLLNTQLNEAMNMYNGAKAVIALYIALGGATDMNQSSK